MTEPALREELLARAAEDQRIRLTNNPSIVEWWKIDADNAKFMRRVIDVHGWPGKRMVGSDGALAAFLLVQHVANDLEFQKKCLVLIEEAVAEGEALPAHAVYLTDRLLVQQGKPQHYGTQLQSLAGKQMPFSIEDEANVDARRAKVGLPPLEDYLREVDGMNHR